MRYAFTYALLCMSLSAIAADSAPVIDKAKVESYLRYAEGFSAGVKIAIDEPTPTPTAGFYRLPVHLSMGDTKEEKLYYISADGKHVFTGPVWDLDSNPFVEILAQLPTSGPSFGPANAKITLVVFSDFECPYCREFARTLRKELPQNYPTVRVVFQDFPIDSLHPWARAASEAAHCIGDGHNEAFWSFHDWIFEHQGEIDSKNVRAKSLEYAKDHNLDSAKIAACIDNGNSRPEVEASVKAGRALDITKTPTFFLNGRPVPGALPWTSLNTLLQMEVKRPPGIPPPDTKR